MRVASGPDKGGTCWHCQTVRACRARSEGVVKANQCLTPRKREAGSNLADMGRSAVHQTVDHEVGGWTPKPSSSGGGEATANSAV